MSGHYYFVEKLKIVEKQLCKLNCTYGKVSHALKGQNYSKTKKDFEFCIVGVELHRDLSIFEFP